MSRSRLSRRRRPSWRASWPPPTPSCASAGSLARSRPPASPERHLRPLAGSLAAAAPCSSYAAADRRITTKLPRSSRAAPTPMPIQGKVVPKSLMVLPLSWASFLAACTEASGRLVGVVAHRHAHGCLRRCRQHGQRRLGRSRVTQAHLAQLMLPGVDDDACGGVDPVLARVLVGVPQGHVGAAGSCSGCWAEAAPQGGSSGPLR